MNLKTFKSDDVEAAMAAARTCWAELQIEDTESICQDVLSLDPTNQEAVELLFRSRVSLLSKGLPRGVERAQELVPQFDGDFEKAFFSGLLRENQARYLLDRRGRQASSVAYNWFRHAMDDFEEANRQDSTRIEATLHWNACLRTLQANPHCAPNPEEAEEHGIE